MPTLTVTPNPSRSMPAEYFRSYRAAHPEYRAREAANRRARRAKNGREDRTAEYARRAAARPSLDIRPIPALHVGHPLFDIVRALLPIQSPGTLLRFPSEIDREDARSEAVLAILEGREPLTAANAFAASERSRRRVEAPLLEFAS